MQDTKIYLVTFMERQKNNQVLKMVSHGVGNNTLLNYCLPPDPPHAFPTRHDEVGIYIPITPKDET